MAIAELVILAEWVSAEKLPGDKKQDNPGRTTYKVVEILKDPKPLLIATKEVVIEEYQAGKPGEQAVLFGW